MTDGLELLDNENPLILEPNEETEDLLEFTLVDDNNDILELELLQSDDIFAWGEAVGDIENQTDLVQYINAGLNTRYEKPESGIPYEDTSIDVQQALDKANSSYQKPESGIPASDLAEGYYLNSNPLNFQTLNEVSTKVDNDISEHNNSRDSHQDIRNAIPWNNNQLQNGMNYQNNVQVQTTANTFISNHNRLGTAHKDIRDAIPTKLKDLTDDELHRTVTDAEKEAWNNNILPDIPTEDGSYVLKVTNGVCTWELLN